MQHLNGESDAMSTNSMVDIDYLKGIAENDLRVLKVIYKESLPEVIKYVRRNSGTTDDAKDVFQEGIMVIFKKVQNNQLQLTTPFHVFLFAVCKRIWLKKLKRKGKTAVTFEEEEAFAYEEAYEEEMIQARKWKLFNAKLKELSEECQQALKMLFNGFSSKQIADAMGYSEEYAKRKKYKCKKSLAEAIKKSPEFDLLKN